MCRRAVDTMDIGRGCGVHLAIGSGVVRGRDGRRAAVLVEVRCRGDGAGQGRSVGGCCGSQVRKLLAVGMCAAEDRTVWLGACRRPVGGRRVRHSADLRGSRWIGGRGDYRELEGITRNVLEETLCRGSVWSRQWRRRSVVGAVADKERVLATDGNIKRAYSSRARFVERTYRR